MPPASAPALELLCVGLDPDAVGALITEAVPVTSGESGREGKMNIYACAASGSRTSCGLRRRDVPVVSGL